MCGFIGRINLREESSSTAPVPLTASLPYLRRRGPDSWQHWQAAHAEVELLHTRLAIVDQDERATQPFSNGAASLTVVFNGEIYNYQQLRTDLGTYPFRTCSDTEVLLAVFSRWGLAGFKRLRGMFSCALVDEGARRVYLARDPIGKKPLYVARWPGGVWFGSSVLALAATVHGPVALRPEVLPEFWRFSYVPPDTSVLEGCLPVAPGAVIEVDFDGKERGRGSCQPDLEPQRDLPLAETVQRVGELVRQSVDRRLHNNPRPVSLLSGGIDSTVVTAHLARTGQGSAITLRSPIPLTLDERYGRYAAFRLGIPLDLVSARAQRLEQDVAWALDLQDEPLGVISFFPLALLIQRAKAYGKILLTGDGADEVFCGYGQPGDWRDPARGATEYAKDERGVVVGTPAPDWMSPWGQYMVGHSLLGHMFVKLDRASAEQGVEARCPLVDWDLLAFVRSLAPDQLFFTGRPKALLKAQLADWPRWFLERRKIGFAYRLRWIWGMRRYRGLRELVAPDAAEAFADQVPPALRCPARQWRARDIFRNFADVWKLLAWTRFVQRLSVAKRLAQESPASNKDRLPVFSGNGCPSANMQPIWSPKEVM